MDNDQPWSLEELDLVKALNRFIEDGLDLTNAQPSLWEGWR